MPYRERSEEAPCSLCERPTAKLCTCCNRPVCPKHLEGSICRHCDEALYRYLKRHDGSNTLFVGLLASIALLVTGAFVATPLIFLGMAGLTVGPFLGMALHKRRIRARFFALVRRTGALPDRSAGESNPELRRLEDFLAKRDRAHTDSSPVDG